MKAIVAMKTEAAKKTDDGIRPEAPLTQRTADFPFWFELGHSRGKFLGQIEGTHWEHESLRNPAYLSSQSVPVQQEQVHPGLMAAGSDSLRGTMVTGTGESAAYRRKFWLSFFEAKSESSEETSAASDF